MFRTSKVCWFGALALALTLSGTALASKKHPGYMRAMDDLRYARALLQRTDGTQPADGLQDEVSITTSNIDNILAQIDEEVGGTQKKTHAVPRIDSRLKWPERLSESLKLLEKARVDCSTEKDNSGDDGLRARVLTQLDQAHTRLTVAIQTVNFDYAARNMPTRND
jgi:hypothetical protein